MKRSDHKCRIDGVAFGEISIKLIKARELTAKYALVNSKTGDRFGGGDAANHFWSEATLKKLGELIDSMESDLLSLVFDGESPADSGSVEVVDQEPDVPGF